MSVYCHCASRLGQPVVGLSYGLVRQLLAVVLLAVVPFGSVMAQEEVVRDYTKEHPLVYEAVWDLWPYSFVNDNGDPDGFNIDLMKLLLNGLKIPYRIELKPFNEAYEDLRAHKSDLMMGLAAGFHDDYGFYGRNSVTLFTQSALSPKDKANGVKHFRDLKDHKVFVMKSSLCHHLMLDYGWGDNAVPVVDMKETILRISNENEGTVVWNSKSLEWLLNKYQIDNLMLTPVDMPHGEYKFMSCDRHLLQRLDSLYTVLNSQERITPILNKWFYPDRQQPTFPVWGYVVAAVVGLLLLLLLFYTVNYRVQVRRIERQISSRIKRLALILETSNVRMWTYDVATGVFTRLNENGQVAYHYTSDEFAHRYHPGDFELLMRALNRLVDEDVPAGTKNSEELEIKFEVRAQDTEEGDTEEHYFTIALSVLDRDANGRPLTILGTKRDISQEHLQQRQLKERELRYWAIFNTPMVGIVYFDREGVLTNINEKGCSILCCDAQEILSEHISFHDLFDLDDSLTLDMANGFYATHVVNLDNIPMSERKVKSIRRTGRLNQEVRLLTVFDDQHDVIGMFGICRDITERIVGIGRQLEAMDRTRQANHELTEYVSNINYVLKAGGMRMANYSPDSHTLTIFSGINEVQLALTQARCMTLIDDRSKKKAMRMLNSMDNRSSNCIDTDIRTAIRGRRGQRLHLEFHFFPVVDDKGVITEYFGLCRDVTELKATEHQLALETAKAQEVENTKNSFLKNMSYEIRTPLNAVVGFAELFEMEHASEDEGIFVQEILDNSDHLLHLINGILFLSRLDAHMIEINKQPFDFATMFEASCEEGWCKYKRGGVKFVVENPYESLVVDIDATNLGHIIHQVAANAAQYTHQGTVRARYDYIGRMLRISFDDTGDGMSADDLSRIFDRFMSGRQNGSGLGLPICKELTEQMGGTLDINSDVGLGTTVWITIPCHASEIKRKKVL